MGVSAEVDMDEFRRAMALAVDTVGLAVKYTAQEVWGNIAREAPVDEGKLAGSFNLEQIDEISWRVFTNTAYAMWVHEGTGIFGPRGQPIVPVSAKVLHWVTKGGEGIFTKSVKGTPPNPYADRAVEKTYARVDEFVARAVRETAGR